MGCWGLDCRVLARPELVEGLAMTERVYEKNI
jgi:hypothetical protein